MSLEQLLVLGTSSQQPTRLRNHNAYLVRMCNQGFLFDPGEGTQKQFILANTAPTCITHILISHFHGDHCLGLGSMLMRLNLDRVSHTVHCYFPATGQKNFTYLRKACIYHENIQIQEHPISSSGVCLDEEKFTISAQFLDHGVSTLGYRIQEKPRVKFDREKLQHFGITGPLVGQIQEEKVLCIDGKKIYIEEVSWMQEGNSFAYILDTRLCKAAKDLANQASLMLCESTYLSKEKHLAQQYGHMTAYQAATIAKESCVQKLILTHFSARYKEVSLFEEEARRVFLESYAAKDLDRFSFPAKKSI